MCQYIKKSRYILIGGTLSLLAFSAAMISIRPGQEGKCVDGQWTPIEQLLTL